MKNENFKRLYKQVFDVNGNITACGREKCIELMLAANKIKTGNYGDTNSGRLNIENVKELYEEL
jgi:hypothetical protein